MSLMIWKISWAMFWMIWLRLILPLLGFCSALLLACAGSWGVFAVASTRMLIAEDDADYSQYRVMMEAAAHSQDGKPAIDEQKALLDASAALSLEPAITSLDEMLASFRTPSLAEGEEISWPEEPYGDSTQ